MNNYKIIQVQRSSGKTTFSLWDTVKIKGDTLGFIKEFYPNPNDSEDLLVKVESRDKDGNKTCTVTSLINLD